MEGVGRRLRWVTEIIEAAEPTLTQVALAARYNVDQSTWNKWVQGTRLASPSTMVAFCRDFGATMDWIYAGQIGGHLQRELELHLVAKHPELALEASAADRNRRNPVRLDDLAPARTSATAE